MTYIPQMSGRISRIKRFFDTSENAVKSQVWIAVSTYVLVAIARKRLNVDLSLHTMLQVLSVTAFEKIPLISDCFLAPTRIQICRTTITN
jgi:hypothetical protein